MLLIEELENTGYSGLKRIAFAPVNDAVLLMAQLGEITAETIKPLDLFPVSEIKLPKGGGCEIKFYDRLKALELLLACEQNQDSAAQTSSFYQALENAAKSASDSGEV